MNLPIEIGIREIKLKRGTLQDPKPTNTNPNGLSYDLHEIEHMFDFNFALIRGQQISKIYETRYEI